MSCWLQYLKCVCFQIYPTTHMLFLEKFANLDFKQLLFSIYNSKFHARREKACLNYML